MKLPVHDIYTGIIAALASGIVLTLVALASDNNLAVRQERADNLRFVRDVYVQGETTMPFSGLDLEGMSLQGLHFACLDNPITERCFSYADFRGAKLRGAKLTHMFLAWADFEDADLNGTDFSNSDLEAVNFVGARNLDKAIFTGACVSSAKWPPDFTPPAGPEECIRRGF